MRFSSSWRTDGFRSFLLGFYGAVYSCYALMPEELTQPSHSASPGIEISENRCSVSGPQRILQPVYSGSSAVHTLPDSVSSPSPLPGTLETFWKHTVSYPSPPVVFAVVAFDAFLFMRAPTTFPADIYRDLTLIVSFRFLFFYMVCIQLLPIVAGIRVHAFVILHIFQPSDVFFEFSGL